MSLDAAAVDEAVRSQIRSRLDQSMFVEAGAGTGKTRALVDRYVALVLAGQPVERLVAITFTEKAAAELRDRIRAELEARLPGSNDPAQAGLIGQALLSLNQAQISTIHAFCQALLRSFAVIAGIDPAFQLQDEVAAERRFEERWRLFLEDLAADPQAVAAINRALDLGLYTGDLQKLAHELWLRTDLAERLQASPLPPPARAVWPDLQDLRDAIADSNPWHALAIDKMRQQAESLLALLERLQNDPGEREANLAASASLLKEGLGRTGNAGAWGSSITLTQARDAGIKMARELNRTLAELRTEALGDVLAVIVRFVCKEAYDRGRDGSLVFDDLIRRVRDVLNHSAEARHSLRQRYQAILIDEFQDTDPLQVEIAMAFACAVPGGVPEPGRLFLVGDPKQSIYRFRRADMAIYSRVDGLMAQAGALRANLTLNRRSQPGVLSWVNGVFQTLIGEGDRPERQPPYRAIAPHRNGELRGPAVSWLGDALEESASDTRRIEADHLAAYCRHVVEDGWQVEDRDSVTRPARLGDIAILIPARTILQPLERALSRAGVPYRVEGGSLVYATQELRDLINCLTAIDDPTDEVAIVGALRSPAYACSDVEIARYKLDGGQLNYRSPAVDAVEGRVGEALRSLRWFNSQRGLQRTAPLIESFIADRRLIEIGLFDAANRDSFRRARFLVEQARSFEAGGPESLRAFVEWLEHRAGDGVLDQEGAALDDDEDAVRILTVHAAKGLEFPIVFLAGLGVAPRLQYPVLGHSPEGELAVSIGAQNRGVFSIGPRQRVADHENEHARAERDRLLYVAATRARDHLVVSLYYRQGARDSAQRLIDSGAREAATLLPPVDITRAASTPPFAGLGIEAEPWTEAEFLEQRRALVAEGRLRVYTSATALTGATQEEPEKPERQDETEPWARGRGGTHLGRAVHAALQSLPWDASDAEIDTIARAQTVAETVPHLAAEAATLIRRALASEAAARARNAQRALREVPFAVRFGDVVVEGFADLIIQDDDGLEIVDWKTDHVPPEAVTERLRHYELQAGLYALGLEEATGLPVRRLTYVFVSAGKEESPGEASLLAEAARLKLDEAARG